MSSLIKERTTGSPIAGSHRMALVTILVLLLAAAGGLAYWVSIPGGNVLTHSLAEPLNGATSAKVDIDAGDGNVTIDGLTGGEQALATGTLQYPENQGLPTWSVSAADGRANLALRASGGGQPWFSLPWAACNGATEWQVHLNPAVPLDLTAHTDGGNVRLDLAGTAVTSVSADTGGGNVDVVLPGTASGLNAKASTGAGNVVVGVPSGMAARIHATTGLGKVTVDPRFNQMGSSTYQSPDYDSAANRVEITVSSGAGNVTVNTK
ncbi:MAG: LiaF domain-containing protein [Chloroflexota bacterium]